MYATLFHTVIEDEDQDQDPADRTNFLSFFTK